MSVHTRQIATAGGPVGLAWVGGGLLAAWQSSAGVGVSLIVADVNATTLEVSRVQGLSLGDDVGAWPVVYASGDRAWIGYREGKSLGGRAVVINRDRGEVWRSSGEAGGNHPIALGRIGGADCLAWQRFGDNAITIHRLDNPAWAIAGGYGAPDGLAALDGGPVLWKDNYGSAWPAMTAPSRAGVLVAGEHPDSGVIVRAPDGRVLRLFEGMAGATPVLAFDAPTGRYAVATWGRLADGVEHGVRVATFLEADLVAATPAVDPWPRYVATGTGADRVVEWLSGGGWTVREDVGLVDVDALWCGRGAWARSGMPAGTTPVDYTHPMQGRVLESGAVQITKALGEGPRAAVFTRAGGYLGLAFDGTNELSKGYRLVWPGTDQTARLYPSLMGVTPNRATRRERERCRRDVPVERLDLATGARLPVVWRGWVEAVFDGPALGDVPAGRYALIGWQFDFLGDGVDGDPRGFLELSLCHADAGPVAWRERRISTGAERTWYGVRNVARVPDPTPQFANAAPTAPPVVIPVPIPKPDPPATTPVVLPARLTLRSAHGLYLCAEGGGGGAVVADRPVAAEWETFAAVPGVVPGSVALRCHDGAHYLCAEDGGGGALVADRTSVGPWESFTLERHGDGVALRSVGGHVVCAEDDRTVNVTRRVVGPWEVWTPTRVGSAGWPVVAPGGAVGAVAPRAGTLFLDGAGFSDANGKRLPFYIHAGDLISRYSRDADGAERMLDECVALGADGFRAWSWLIGEPHWTGRTFRGSWAVLQRVVAACKARNLRLVLCQGDVWQAGEATARAWIADLSGFIRSEGPEWFDVVGAGNETWHNGCDNPDVLASAMRPLANVGPILMLSDFPADQPWPGNSAEERKAAMLAAARRWSQGPASVLSAHPGFSDGDGCIRRSWNCGYELQEVRSEWMNDEPRGWGRNVTNFNRIDRSVQLAMAAATWISGGGYVAMSSPGVISDGTRDGHFDGGESFLDMPGFRDLAALRAWLPAGVMGWKRVHGGPRNGSPRVFAVDEGAEGARADHAINTHTGEYVAVLYGGTARQVRAASVEDFDPALGGGRRIVKGQIA